RRTFPAVKQPALSVDVQEHFLNKVFCFSVVAKNSSANVSNGMSVTPKEERQRLPIPNLNVRYKRLVSFQDFSWPNCLFVAATGRGSRSCNRAMKSNCDRRIHACFLTQKRSALASLSRSVAFTIFSVQLFCSWCFCSCTTK